MVVGNRYPKRVHKGRLGQLGHVAYCGIVREPMETEHVQ